MIIVSSRLNLLGTVINLAKETYKGFGALGKKFGLKTSASPPPKKNSSSQKNFSSPPKTQSISRRATAPYNFVSLPEKILPAQFENVDGYKEHVQSAENISGEISLDIEALTPLFIGGVGSKSFAPVGVPIIPGSSLRGMFKNIFKVVTCGAFRGRTTSQKKGEDFNDEHIYFRCLMASKNSPAWMSDLNKLYNDRMTGKIRGKDGKLHIVKNARPGFLICTSDNKFFIAPSTADGKPMNHDRKDDKLLILEYEEKFGVKVPVRSFGIKWDGGTAYIITGSQPRHRLLEKKHAGKQFIRYTKIEYVDWSREHWIALPDDVQTSYEHDRNRRGVNLFKDKGILKRAELERLTGKTLSDVKSLIPCHYLEENGQVTAFGHGQCFRIPYQKRIGDAVPKNLQSENFVDLSDAVFGKEKFWASRVYFEDAIPIPKNFETLPEETTHPLMQPNPTSYQLYLTQNDKNGRLKHWDCAGAQIRGYKFYWHKSKADWRASNSEIESDRGKTPDKRLTKEMTPLAEGSKFTAKIRFKNLSAVELGALMMIFDLNGAKNPAYKIGQGKPFGFGSIKISPTLFVEDSTAYTELFGANGWKTPCREENPAAYLDAFKNYLERCDMNSVWQKVMKELEKILDLDVTNLRDWDSNVKSMSGDVSKSDGVDERFTQRIPLPTIFEVVK